MATQVASFAFLVIHTGLTSYYLDVAMSRDQVMRLLQWASLRISTASGTAFPPMSPDAALNRRREPVADSLVRQVGHHREDSGPISQLSTFWHVSPLSDRRLTVLHAANATCRSRYSDRDRHVGETLGHHGQR
jgi:hypothetical protein